MQNVGTTNGWFVPVFALFLSAFAVCTAEMIVAGVLPALARDLDVDIATAGLLITGYAIGVALFGPALALATGGVSRRLLLMALMAIFVIGNVLCAIATSYWALLGARLLVAASHGLFFGVSMVIATQVAPEGKKSTAISFVVAGVTLASVAGVPVGTAIGQAFGWRTSFWAIAGAGALASIALAFLIPEVKQARAAGDLKAELRAAVRTPVLFSYAMIALFMVGVMSLFSYVVPFLTEAAGVPIAYVPWVLFAMGAVGVFGNLAGGRLGDWNPTFTALGILTGTAILNALLAQSATVIWLALPLLVGSWLIGFGFPAPVQGRILKEIADAPNFGSTLISTAFNVGIAGGAALGAAAIASGWNYGQLPLLTALFHALALVVTFGLVAFDRRRVPAAA